MKSNERQRSVVTDEAEALAKVRLVVRDVLMSTDVPATQVETATAALLSAMENDPTRWAFRVHAGGSRT